MKRGGPIGPPRFVYDDFVGDASGPGVPVFDMATGEPMGEATGDASGDASGVGVAGPEP